MINLSIKNRFLIGAIFIILVPLLIGSVVTYNKITSGFKAEARHKMVQIALDLANLMNSVSQQEIRFIGSIAKNPHIERAVSNKDYEQADRTLTALHKKLGKGYESIFIADTMGIVRANAIPGGKGLINISDRPYFIKAAEGIENLSEPVVSRLTQKLIMVAAYPIVNTEGEFIGIVGGTINVDSMIHYISTIKIGQTGYPILLDSDGRVILHPDERFILNRHNEIYLSDAILNKMENRQSGSVEYMEKGFKKIAGYAPVGDLNWNVLVIQDFNEIMAPARSLLYFMVFIGVVFLIATLSGLIVLSGLISKPIEKAISTLSEISKKSTDLVITFDQHKRIIQANQKAEELTGNPVTDLVGTQISINSLDGSQDSEIWAEVQNGKTWHGRTRIMGPQNKEIILEALLAPLMDTSDHIFGYVEIGRDITRELEIESRFDQLQKMESLGTLTGGIAHDFNNILSGVYGYAQISLKHLDDPQRIEKSIKRILSAAERASKLVKQILTFSRQTNSETIPIKVASVIEEAVSLLRASIPKSIKISLSIDCNPTVIGDKTQLHQVIVNLCTNAAQAIGEEKGTIDISLVELDVDQEFASRHPGLVCGPHVQISVTDSGPGIDPGIINKVFDPFFTTKPAGEGTGLGLSVVHGIVLKMTGSISISSQPGEGTSFNIVIPAIDKKPVEKTKPCLDTPIPGGKEKILLVDDEASIIETLNAALESFGYSVRSFTDSEEALSEFQNNAHEYDAIVTDQTMPKLTGIDLAIEAQKVKNNIPILLSTGYIDQHIEKAARQHGIHHFIKKPATIHEMALAVRKTIDGE